MNKRFLWIASALVFPVSYLTAHFQYIDQFSDRVSAVPLLIAGLLTTGLAFGATRRLAGDRGLGIARAWYGCVAIVFLAAALPVQLDFGWPPVTLALAALGIAVFAGRVGDRGLVVVAVASGIGAAGLLVMAALNPYHYVHQTRPVLSWISYGHLVPLAALLGAAWMLRAANRRREALVPGLGAVVIGFVWINLSILDIFASPDEYLTFFAERHQERDLAQSISWAVYALVLLVCGVWMKISGLRWTSLALFLMTIAKVFLYDLGELEGMNRVGSLAGLAISLIAVSLLYQRFVFRSTAKSLR